MATNSFKQLAEDSEKQFPHAPPEIEQELMGSMRMTHFVGDVVELYLPRLLDMILSLFGASKEGLKGAPTKKEVDRFKDSGDMPEGHSKSDD